MSDGKIHVVAVWYLIRLSRSVYSTQTSFISAVFGSVFDVFGFNPGQRSFRGCRLLRFLLIIDISAHFSRA